MLSAKSEKMNSTRPTVRGDVMMKSGPWMSQYNVIMNMNSHYQRLSKAKSTIDMSPPKSLSTNTRKRDSVSRSVALGFVEAPKTYRSPSSSSRPQTARRHTASRPSSSRLSLSSRSEKPTRPNSSNRMPQGWDYPEPKTASAEAQLNAQLESLHLLRTEDFDQPVGDEPEEDVQREKDALAEKLILMYGGEGGQGGVGGGGDMRRPSRHSNEAPNTAHAPQIRPQGSLSQRTHRSMTQQQQQPQPRLRPRATRSGDVLESRSHVFTATEKDFSPRILNKPKATSRLSQSKHYYRPKPKPPIKPSMLAGSSLVHVVDHQGSSGDTRSSTPLEDWRLSRENDERFETNSSEGVPKLDISLDQDNLRWLKRQESLKSRQRKVSENSLASLREEVTRERDDVVLDDGKSALLDEAAEEQMATKADDKTEAEPCDDDDDGTEKNKLKDPRDTLSTKINSDADADKKTEKEEPEMTSTKPASRAIDENKSDANDDNDDDDASVEEKELVYLKFIQDVTSDLLSTGRISEGILAEIFKRHVEDYGEAKIPPKKAAELQRQLRKDLGFSADDDVDRDDATVRGLTQKLVDDMDDLVAGDDAAEG